MATTSIYIESTLFICREFAEKVSTSLRAKNRSKDVISPTNSR